MKNNDLLNDICVNEAISKNIELEILVGLIEGMPSDDNLKVIIDKIYSNIYASKAYPSKVKIIIRILYKENGDNEQNNQSKIFQQ